MASEFFGYTADNKSNPKATIFRSVVLHLKYAVFLLLGALVWASFTAEQGVDKLRKDECALFGADAQNPCVAPSADQLTQNETLYGLGVAVTIINAALMVLSLFTHLHPDTDNLVCATFQYHGVFRALTCILNIALFAGLVGVFREDDDDNNGAKLLAEDNLENNVYFKDTFDPYAASAAGLGISLLDAVLGSIVIFWVYGKRCAVPESSGAYGGGE